MNLAIDKEEKEVVKVLLKDLLSFIKQDTTEEYDYFVKLNIITIFMKKIFTYFTKMFGIKKLECFKFRREFKTHKFNDEFANLHLNINKYFEGL